MNIWCTDWQTFSYFK